ncbi:ferric-dicitrate binding protein FerR (iron transport regulator) [Pedobacter sp. AK017]|uniref:FecR family protein n=1 Tax=Pedobacter sp. AK017 TaxID=2723073 RepID=UPI0016168345|nr:FecR domain-containing protein [Pedobacter sp. AK017]MBB5437286.1 ferric-dicitrate binding protein FerR (iron transport regulator) [Pedobacter sp. AK017]
MDKQRAEQLLDKYLQGEATEHERALVEYWLIQRAGKSKSELDELPYVQRHAEMWEIISKSISVSTPRIKLWPRIAIAAAAVAAIVFGVFFFKAPGKPEPGSGSANYTNDIAPGKNTATLTLANGKTIILSDVKTGVIVAGNSLKYNDNTVISTEGRDLSSLRSVEMTSLSTPRGGMYQITLPDGSRAWLNADTKISFPSQFIGKERKILIINGEVYFEVAKNKEKPFIVVADQQEVEVLGTHFNISAYKDEGSTKTTLLEGSVKVSSLRGKRSDEETVILKPNQQSIVTGSSGISVKTVDAEEAIAWKQGVFIFNSTPLDPIMRQVARWYNVDVIYEDPELKTELMGGAVSRYDNVSRILKTLENTGAVKFKIEGRKVIVSK